MAPRRSTATSFANSSSNNPVNSYPHAAPSSHAISRKQPVVRVVQTRPPKRIKAEAGSFRSIVHLFTGHHLNAAQQLHEEGDSSETSKIKVEIERNVEKARIMSGCTDSPPSVSTTPLLSSSPSYPCSINSSSPSPSSSSCSVRSTISPRTEQITRELSDVLHIASPSLELDIQEYGSLLSPWDEITAIDFSPFNPKAGKIHGSMCKDR